MRNVSEAGEGGSEATGPVGGEAVGLVVGELRHTGPRLFGRCTHNLMREGGCEMFDDEHMNVTQLYNILYIFFN